MKHASLLSLLALVLPAVAACGGETPDSPASPSAPPVAASADEPASSECAGFERIAAARDDAPAFSSLAGQQPLAGAVCAAGPVRLFDPVSNEVRTREGYACTWYENADASDPAAGQETWNSLQQPLGTCFSGWTIGGQAMRGEGATVTRSFEIMQEGAHPPVNVDGASFWPLAARWIYHDAAAEPPGHRIEFYALAPD